MLLPLPLSLLLVSLMLLLLLLLVVVAFVACSFARTKNSSAHCDCWYGCFALYLSIARQRQTAIARINMPRQIGSNVACLDLLAVPLSTHHFNICTIIDFAPTAVSTVRKKGVFCLSCQHITKLRGTRRGVNNQRELLRR